MQVLRGMAFFHYVIRAVGEIAFAFVSGAVRTTIDRPFGFYAMANNAALAVRALGGKGVDGAFKGIENMAATLERDRKRLVIIVMADFALHRDLLTGTNALYMPPKSLVKSR